jgi:tyrocidine synthetase III
MVPAKFLFLDIIPVTSNGKIDKSKLLSESYKEIDETEHIDPNTLTQERLVKIFTSVIEKKRISVEDNFFEIGINSLSATQIIYNVREEFNLDVPLKVIFEKSNILELAEEIDNIQRNSQKQKPQIKKIERNKLLK